MIPKEIVSLILLLNIGRFSCLRFHSYYSDGMVLQRDVPVQVWGYDLGQGEEAEGSLSCVGEDNRKYFEILSVKNSLDGVWSVILPSLSADNICDIKVKILKW